MMIKCVVCMGEGTIDDPKSDNGDVKVCPNCRGTGEVEHIDFAQYAIDHPREPQYDSTEAWFIKTGERNR